MEEETKYEPGDIKINQSENIYGNDQDLPWGKKERKGLSNMIKRQRTSAVIIGVIIFVTVVIFIMLFVPWQWHDDKYVKELETALNLQEERFTKLTEINERLKALDDRDKQYDLFKERLDHIEKSLNLRLAELEKKLDELHQISRTSNSKSAEKSTEKNKPVEKTVVNTAVTPTPIPTRAPIATKAPESEPAASSQITPKPTIPAESPKSDRPFAKKRYIKVEPGDTLYSISRRYEMTVEELRALNKLSNDSSLKSGQILIVNAPVDQ